MSGVCTAVPPHLDAHHHKNRIVIFIEGIRFKSASCMNFCNFTHNNPR